MASNELYYSSQFRKEVFTGKSVKEAYMKAVKWYATNVIARDKLHNVQVEFIKDEEKNQITLVLYATLKDEEMWEHQCNLCKEMHCSFFINEATECSRCTAAGYRRQLERKILVKSSYYEELLRKDK